MGHDFVVITTARPKPDAATVAAVDLARAALVEEVGAGDVGDHLGHAVEGERVVTHLFACSDPATSVAVVGDGRPRQPQQGRHGRRDRAGPGDGAIVAPSWVPYRERIKPGDLSPGDLLPVADDDPRLVPTYSFGDDPLDADDKAQIRAVAQDLGLGRVRTLSPEGREFAAQRWYDGDGGPEAPIARSAPDQCTTCGFLIRIAGPLSELFGVCANGDANDDGRIVSFDHGCGAHSEVRLAKKHAPLPPPGPSSTR